MVPITNVYETENGSELIAYLTSKGIDRDLVNLDIWGHKSLVRVKDVASFGLLASKLGIQELRKLHGLHFVFRVGLTSWTIALPSEEVELFLKNYKNLYKIEEVKI